MKFYVAFRFLIDILPQNIIGYSVVACIFGVIVVLQVCGWIRCINDRRGILTNLVIFLYRTAVAFGLQLHPSSTPFSFIRTDLSVGKWWRPRFALYGLHLGTQHSVPRSIFPSCSFTVGTATLCSFYLVSTKENHKKTTIDDNIKKCSLTFDEIVGHKLLAANPLVSFTWPGHKFCSPVVDLVLTAGNREETNPTPERFSHPKLLQFLTYFGRDNHHLSM